MDTMWIEVFRLLTIILTGTVMINTYEQLCLFSEGLLRDSGGGRFLWESVPFCMEEPFMRLGADAGRQILALNLL